MKHDEEDNLPFIVIAAIVLMVSAFVLAWVLA
jgi:hypothetical protein